MPEESLLEVEDLTLVKQGPQGPEALVEGLSFSLARGQSLGLVGESGSGKSLSALAILRLLPWPLIQVASGSITFAGRDLLNADEFTLNSWRGARIAAIFQDALAALNPVRKIGSQLDELFSFHQRPESKSTRQSLALASLTAAGLNDGPRILKSYPHELSGGMRQRVLLAMALLLGPELLIADEPTTALDVILQAQWVQRMQQLKAEHHLSLIFISHDFALVLELCERSLVLFQGRVVESGPSQTLLDDPRHPYTQAMIAALPRWDKPLQVPARTIDMKRANQGCPYASRCPKVFDRCHVERPELQTQGDRQIACHLSSS